MIQEKFQVGGLHLDKPRTTFTERKGLKAGDICRAKSELFSGWLRCEVVKLYQNAAMVKIIACRNPQDDAVQHELDDVAIVRIKDLTVIRGG